MTSDEIEIACDALWFVKQRDGLDGDGSHLWDRLQPIRHGDYGGSASTTLNPAEVQVVTAALRSIKQPDGDERRLLAKLASSEGDSTC